MKKHFLLREREGFTLIELLVVIAIIAILSATILVALNSARAKAKDAKVQSEMSDLRAQMELAYTSNGDSYGTAGNCSLGLFQTGTDNASVLIKGIAKDTGDITYANMNCAAVPNSWAVGVKLPTGSFWCVDSNGASFKSTQTSLPMVISTNSGVVQCTP